MLRVSILAVLALASAAPLHAATFTVTRADDPAPNGCAISDCSLREAVLAANANAGRDQIMLAKLTYNLTRIAGGVSNDDRVGALWVRGDTDFIGQGAGFNQTWVRWSASVVPDSPVFFAFNVDVPLDVSWSQMKVSHGVGSSGGCFYLPDAWSNFSFTGVIVRDCRALSGGAIATTQSTVSLIGTTIEFNNATNDGGGLSLAYASTLITSNARIRSNTAGRDGGGVAFTHHFLSAAELAYWQDDGLSTVTSNVAGRDGGGAVASGDILLDIDGSDANPTALMYFAKNRAGRAGGAISRAKRFVTLTETLGLDLRQVRLGYNFAPQGGGLDAVERVHIEDVEFKGNSTTDSATVGNGGGLHLNVANRESTITRSSFTINNAGTMAGGAIYSSGCAAISLRNVSIQDNTASSGAAIGSHGTIDLRHVTASGNAGINPALSQYSVRGGCGSTFATAANSLIADSCSARYASAGGNQYGAEAAACAATRTDQRQASDATFGLSQATFGGPFVVTGWNSDGAARPQRDFGLAANCMADDVRGLARSDGFCDAGAFEQQN